LADHYAAEQAPVVVLEHNAAYPTGVRLERWRDAFGGQTPFGVPWVMVDSGFQARGGYENFEPLYRAMIDAALERPPAAELSAWYERMGSSGLRVFVDVTNRSGTPWTEEQRAAVNVIVYELRRVQHTSRFVRASDARPVGVLADGATAAAQFALSNVPVTDWTRALVLVLVELRPNPSLTTYEALQAAHAVERPPVVDTATATPTETPMPTPTLTPTLTATLTPTVTSTMSPTMTASTVTTELPANTVTVEPTASEAPPTPTTQEPSDTPLPPPTDPPGQWRVWLPVALR
jgi:hypothetical protein